MRAILRWLRLPAIAIAMALSVAGGTVEAATPEERAFNAAAAAFKDGFYERADTEFGKFALEFTNSAKLNEAFLYQAQARLKQTNYAGALELLSARGTNAGEWADQFQFWRAETLLAQGSKD